MQTEVTTHCGLDSLKRPLAPGRYVVICAGKREAVNLVEDPDSGLLIVVDGCDRRLTLDDVEPSAIFARMVNLKDVPSGARLSNINSHLARATTLRQELAAVESVLASELGCVCGDGSPLWEGISAAVRDGMGTAVDLLDLAGALRR